MKRGLSLLIFSLIFLGGQGVPAAAESPPVYGEIPDFRLTNQSGKPFALADLKGKIWIADFIFTRCAGVCPLMSSKMRELQKPFESEPRMRFVSFTVDPDYDRPSVLEEYAKRYQAAPDRWFFLTGDKAMLYALSEKHFLLGVGEIPEAEREAADQAVRHSSKFALIDSGGRVRGYYDWEEAGSLDRLIQDAEALLREV